MHSTYVRMARQRAEQQKRRGRHQQNAKALKAKLKDCCRKLIAFFFTQVGVCGLIVGYTIIGAFMFIALESDAKQPMSTEVFHQRRSCVDYLWNITHHLNVLNHEQWRRDVNLTIYKYQHQLVRQIRRGYDGSGEDGAKFRWTIPAALMYCITIYTTIGYGNLTPKTPWGKIATVSYALVGIPLMLLYMANIGDILATSFKYTYKTMCKCPKRRRRTLRIEDVIPSTIAIQPDPPSGHPSFKEKRKKNHHKNENPVELLELSVAATLPEQVLVVSAEPEPEITVNNDPQTVSVTSCLCVMFSFVIGGAVLFSIWEGWNYVDGSYFCFTSLLTIGFGDLVPGQTIYSQSIEDGNKPSDAVDSKLIFCAIYLLLGMALLAMCFNLMQEEVFMKIKRFGRRLGLLRERFAS